MIILQYCLYLRKSRADAEAEERGEGETLARHEKSLLELAKKLNLNVTEIYREIVSGETIAARPVMQRLLQEVEQGIWNGVLVMEVERLARGDTIDQGIVAQTFKLSDTKIITPVKTYDPNNEFDEEYFEFGLFMSRREYKTINRRLQRGRVTSVMEGKFVGNKTPYGYERVRIKDDSGYTLSIVEEEAEIVRLIYEWYTMGEKQTDGTHKRLGTALIARRLNNMKIPAKMGGAWTVSTIRDILKNPVYIGKIRWNSRKCVKKVIDGQVVISRPRVKNSECIIVQGLHSPIISEGTYNIAQEYMSKNPPRPIGERSTIKNPLAGIVICGQCGHHMVRRPYNNGYSDTLICAEPTCDNVSSNLNLVEERIIQTLKDWLGEYKLKWNTKSDEPKKVSQAEVKRKALHKLQTELDTLNKQLNKTHDLLEQGVYDTNMFLERSRSLTSRINQTKNDITVLEADLNGEIVQNQSAANLIPKVEKLLEVYDNLFIKDKNDMLKEVLEKVIYVKDISARRTSPDNFEITMYPKVPVYSDKK